MSVIEVSLIVIATCMVIITASILASMIVSFRFFRKMNDDVSLINNDLRPAVLKLKGTVLNFVEVFRLFNATVDLLRGFKSKLKERRHS